MARHYVAHHKKGIRRYWVMRATHAETVRPGKRDIFGQREHRVSTYRYTVVSKHFTAEGARKVAHRLNREAGQAQ